MKFAILLVTSLLCLSSAAFAGDELLNGGDVVACPGFEIPSYQVLDLYEGRTLYGFDRAEIEGATPTDIAKNLIARIEKFDPNRAALYKQYLSTFEAETRMVSGADFDDITDEGWTALPNGCSRVQTVAQLSTPTPDGKKYLINAHVWISLNNVNRAALIMHEIIYREGLLPKNGFKNSSGVRYFNSFLHSKQLEGGDQTAYLKSLQFAGFSLN